MASYKYKVLRVCYWNNILWNPEETQIVTLDADVGIPPHHFEPLDGGPVQGTPEPVDAAGPVELPGVPNPLPNRPADPMTLKGLSDQQNQQEQDILNRRMAADTPGGPLRRPTGQPGPKLKP